MIKLLSLRRHPPPYTPFSTSTIPLSRIATASSSVAPPKASENRLFTAAEMALLPMNNNPLDRKALKKQAKQAAKNSRVAERKEREADADMFDAAAMFGSMMVTAPKRPEIVKKKKKVEKQEKKKGEVLPVTLDEETKKEMEFMSFLNHVGGEHHFRVFLRSTC